MRNNYCELVGNVGQEHICFSGGMVSCPVSGNAYVCLEMIDGAFHDHSYFISGIPVGCRRICGNPCFHKYRRSVLFWWCYMALCSHGPIALLPYVPLGRPILYDLTGFFHSSGRHISCQGFYPWDRWDSRKYYNRSFQGCFYSSDYKESGLWNENHPLKTVSVDYVKGGITEESIRMEIWVKGKEI